MLCYVVRSLEDTSQQTLYIPLRNEWLCLLYHTPSYFHALSIMDYGLVCLFVLISINIGKLKGNSQIIEKE